MPARRFLARAAGLFLLLGLLATRPAAADLRLLSLPTKELIYDPLRQRIYASVPSTGGARANSVTIINPETGEIGPSIDVGLNPGKLALSDDGRYLYVSIGFAGSVRRVDLESGKPDLQFALSPLQGAAAQARDLEVAPGNAHAVAIATADFGGGLSAASAAIYDDGVARPKLARPLSGFNSPLPISRLEFGAPPSRLYGLITEGEFSIVRMTVDQTGIVVQDRFSPFQPSDRGIQDFEYLDGLLYFNSGQVVDPEARRQVHSFGDFESRTLVRPDPLSRRVFFLGTDSNVYPRVPRLLAFDLQSRQPAGMIDLPLTFDQAGSLLTWGKDGIAFHTDRDQVVLLRTRLRTPEAVQADVAVAGRVSPPLVRAGDSVAVQLQVHNYGPESAAGVVLESVVPEGAALVRVGSTRGRCTQRDGRITCELGELPAGMEATVTLELRATAAGVMLSTASVRSQTPDPDAGNNTATQRTRVVALVAGSSGAAGRLPVFGVEVRPLLLPAHDLVYDRVTRRIYASVPSSAGAIGNSVVGIDPETGAVGPPIFVGSEPGKLALSGDGRALYVALDGAGAVRRVDLGAQSAGLQFSLGNDPSNGPLLVEDMEVLPGAPEAVAIARRNEGFTPRHEGVAVYDNGVMRPRVTAEYTGSNAIEFSASAVRLYGYDNESSEHGLRRMEIDDLGPRVLDEAGNLITGAADIRFDQGLLFSSNGRVIDPEARLLVGTVPNLDDKTLVAPDAAAGLLFYLTGEGGIRQLRVHDAGTLLPLATLGIPEVIGRAGSLIRWGGEREDGGGVAFLTDQDQVFLLRTSLQEPVALTLTIEPTAVESGSPASGKVTLGAPAPDGGAVVALSSTDPALATPPASVTIPAGATSATFPIATQFDPRTVDLAITATYRGAFRTAPLRLLPDLRPTLVGLIMDPFTVVGRMSARAVISFSRVVPPAGVEVSLTSSRPDVVEVPASVFAQPGRLLDFFSVQTRAVTVFTEVTITATYRGASRTAKLRVLPAPRPSVTSLALSPNAVVGGDSLTATVTLSGPAPAGGRGVGLGKADPGAVLSMPAQVVVPAGTTTARFTIRTRVVTTRTRILVWAAGGEVARAELELLPGGTPPGPSLTGLALSPAEVAGGGSGAGAVTLSEPAPTGAPRCCSPAAAPRW